jgi:hypothetical protein
MFMKTAELKEKLEQSTAESRKYYRLYPTLYRDVLLWEDYCRLIETNRHKKYHAVKNSARYDVCEMYGICEKTFFAIRSELKDLCEDVE